MHFHCYDMKVIIIMHKTHKFLSRNEIIMFPFKYKNHIRKGRIFTSIQSPNTFYLNFKIPLLNATN